MLKNFRSLVPKAFNVQFVSLPYAGSYNFHSSQSYNKKTSVGEVISTIKSQIEGIVQLVSLQLAAQLLLIFTQIILFPSLQNDIKEFGKVISIGDGIARVFGLSEVQAGEMVEFKSGVRGMALNLETDNVGVVVLGNDR